MSNKQYGLRYERVRKKRLEAEGYLCNRCRGSFGIFDIVAVNKLHLLLESIKSTKLKYFSYTQDIKAIAKFSNAPDGTMKRLILFHKGKLRVLYEDVIKHEKRAVKK